MKGRTDTNRSAIINELKIGNYNEKIKDIIQTNWQTLNHNNQHFSKKIEINFDAKESKIEIGDFILGYVNNVTKRSVFVNPVCKITLSEFSIIAENKPFMVAK